MSLRHSFPEVELPELRRSEEPLKAVPAMRKPSEVTFRTGKDMAAIAQAMAGKHVVRVLAAVGSGKSTLLPRELCKQVDAALVHVVPSKLLAVAQYDYLVNAFPDTQYKLALGAEDEYSKSGITITYSAAVCAKLLKETGDKPLGEVLLYLDESHESDAYTYVLHEYAHAIPGVLGVVFASANHDPERMPMRETLGDVESRRFSHKDLPKDWNPHDRGKPWSITEFNGSVLMFVEPNRVADELVSAYSMAGATAYRLSAKMDVAVFRKAMADCSDSKGGIVVLVADYSFRSGFTFDVSTIIDSGVVGYTAVEGGTQKRAYRQVYAIEVYQAQGRGGRTQGSNCVCYLPDIKTEAALCNLEGVELDAAAVLFRCLGYAVPSLLRGSKFAKGKIPKDLVYSLNDVIALQSQAPTFFHDYVHLTEEEEQKQHDDDLVDLVNSYGEKPIANLYDDVQLGVPSEVENRHIDPHKVLNDLALVASSTSCLTPPAYYMVPGLKYDNVTTRLYGEDVDKCVDELQRHPDLLKGMRNSDRREVIAMLLNHYNLTNASVIGMSFAANYEDMLVKVMARFPSQTSNWAVQVSENIRVKEARLNVVAGLLNQLKPPSLHYVMVDPLKQIEDKVAAEVAEQLKRAVKATSRKLDRGAYETSMVSRVDMPGHKALAEDMLTIDQGDMGTFKCTLYPRKLGKRAMWDLKICPNDTDRWQNDDFIDAGFKLLAKANVSTRSISSLILPTYVSSENHSMITHAIRSGSYRRTSQQFIMN